MGRHKLTPRERFERLVDRSGDCHVWLGETHTGKWLPYGVFNIRGSTVRAHRVAWEFAYDYPPSELFVCHTCDNTLCVNPEHLFLGTHQDNMDDMVRKGRSKKGETNAASKLTEKEVIEMRALYRTQEWRMPDLAKRYNVSLGLIHKVIRGTGWAHIPGAVPSHIKHKDAKGATIIK